MRYLECQLLRQRLYSVNCSDKNVLGTLEQAHHPSLFRKLVRLFFSTYYRLEQDRFQSLTYYPAYGAVVCERCKFVVRGDVLGYEVV